MIRIRMDNWLNLETPLAEIATRPIPPDEVHKTIAAYVTSEGSGTPGASPGRDSTQDCGNPSFL
ncbi:hypothetical protein Scep_025784 [Stephania cephalantha]|uniref:Uncharacterized protein n=1 Tax=Stephania cephalantha TaxID=152367 RepID=A0AAP0EIU7_9MAGN